MGQNSGGARFVLTRPSSLGFPVAFVIMAVINVLLGPAFIKKKACSACYQVCNHDRMTVSSVKLIFDPTVNGKRRRFALSSVINPLRPLMVQL